MSDFPLKLGELLDVEIEKLSFGGSGIARVVPKGGDVPVVVFVPFSAPGDRLQIKISQIKKRHAEAEIQKIIQPGVDREQAPCSVYGQCGGCNFQHLSYESQLKNKQAIVEEFLKKFIDASTKVLPIVPSSMPLHYRNRAILKSDGTNLGFYRKNSHSIVDIDRCWIMEESLSQQIPQIKKNLPKEAKSIELSLKKSEIAGEDFSESEEGFSQVNRFQNTNLIEAAIEIIRQGAAESPSRIFDLYAGSGNFSFPILEQFRQRKLIGVEMHAGATKIAQEKLKSLKISPKNAEFYNADVAIFLRRFPIEKNDTILLDPPRIGCSEEVISSLAAAAPRQIIYVSCDPASLARDLGRIWSKSPGKYKLKQVQCFDMFPQTHHVETLVELTN